MQKKKKGRKKIMKSQGNRVTSMYDCNLVRLIVQKYETAEMRKNAKYRAA